eukprot:TRINITY_DN86440_c0_g1_i1.p1 TRINITY_DN86440_c0_g1~~TRINITY_DN86440_c0_g1_i1.p1  ORF type:complete len:396 (+),score=22.67 TRINITY_DN86440_c0_g1_i1:60-1247(+)
MPAARWLERYECHFTRRLSRVADWFVFWGLKMLLAVLLMWDVIDVDLDDFSLDMTATAGVNQSPSCTSDCTDPDKQFSFALWEETPPANFAAIHTDDEGILKYRKVPFSWIALMLGLTFCAIGVLAVFELVRIIRHTHWRPVHIRIPRMLFSRLCACVYRTPAEVGKRAKIWVVLEIIFSIGHWGVILVMAGCVLGITATLTTADLVGIIWEKESGESNTQFSFAWQLGLSAWELPTGYCVCLFENTRFANVFALRVCVAVIELSYLLVKGMDCLFARVVLTPLNHAQVYNPKHRQAAPSIPNTRQDQAQLLNVAAPSINSEISNAPNEDMVGFVTQLGGTRGIHYPPDAEYSPYSPPSYDPLMSYGTPPPHAPTNTPIGTPREHSPTTTTTHMY